MQMTLPPAMLNGQRGAIIDHMMGGPYTSAAASPQLGLFIAGNGTGAGTTLLNTPDASAFGVYDAQTGTTSTGRHGLQSTPTNLIFGSGALMVTWRFQLPLLADGVESYSIQVGFGDLPNALPTDGAFLYWDNTQTNFRYRTRANGIQTDVDSGLAPVAATWYTFRAAINSAGNNVGFTINGGNGQSINSNIPTGVGRETGLMAFILKSLGTTSRHMYLDYCLLEWSEFNA